MLNYSSGDIRKTLKIRSVILKESQFKWQINEVQEESQVLVAELETLKMSPKLAPLLWNRNIKDSDKLAHFFKPQLTDLHDPFLLFDMEKVVTRIQEAVEKGERILVYGDYDADGITSTTVMKEAIELIGGDVVFYLPNRFKDGYGPNRAVYQRMIEEEGIQLIVTVDNGISGHDAIEYAMEKGVDVIVTDHHELPENLPSAFGIIHPRHPKGEYPFGDLAGVGVAFKVATALLGEIPTESLDLVAIGTIADLVSLTDENRVLVKIGLEIMKQTERIGLQMLGEVAEFDLSEVTEETIGFSIGPRLNAIGRLGDANPGVTLLSTFDDEEANNIATHIQETNKERQRIVKEITAEAIAMSETYKDEPVLFLLSENWHEGVLGIVASQVVSKVGKPVIVLRHDKETNILKGSGRSIQSVDLFKVLSSTKEMLTSFGGHHMAAGLSFDFEKLDAVKEQVEAYFKENNLTEAEKDSLVIDGELPISEITVEFIETLKMLAPFGTDNPSPYFMIKDNKIEQLKQIGASNNHLKYQAVNGEVKLDCIAFNYGEEMSEFSQGESIQQVGQLSINEWNGFRKPQFMLTDYQVSGFQIFDIRGKKGFEVKPVTENIAYFVFNDEHESMVKSKNPEDIFYASQVTQNDMSRLNGYTEIVIVDCPYDLEKAKEIFSNLTVERLYFRVQVSTEHYMTGLPSREQFGKLFKLIATQPSIDVRYKLNDMASYLKIEKKLLIFMINVFFDLGFVTIENGLMAKVDQPTTKPLQESKIYQEYEQKIEMEKLFLYSNINEIKEWILQQEEVK